MENKTLTIMFVDVQGFTSRTAIQTREEHQVFLNEIKSFIEKHVKTHFGKLVKVMGDGFLVTFESPTNAVICGIQVQKDIDKRNASVLKEDDYVRFRIGISTGEVSVDDNGDVSGDAVNIAARIQKFAEPNDVYISETSYLAMNKAEVMVLDLGPQKFKNVLQEIRVYKAVKDAKDLQHKGRKTNINSWIAIPVGLVVLAVIASLPFIFYKREAKKEPQASNFARFRPLPREIKELEQASLPQLEEKLKTQPNNLMLILRLAGESFDAGDMDGATNYFKMAEAIDPKFRGILLHKATRFEEEKNYNEAIKILELINLSEPRQELKESLTKRIEHLKQLVQ